MGNKCQWLWLALHSGTRFQVQLRYYRSWHDNCFKSNLTGVSQTVLDQPVSIKTASRHSQSIKRKPRRSKKVKDRKAVEYIAKSTSNKTFTNSSRVNIVQEYDSNPFSKTTKVIDEEEIRAIPAYGGIPDSSHNFYLVTPKRCRLPDWLKYLKLVRQITMTWRIQVL